METTVKHKYNFGDKLFFLNSDGHAESLKVSSITFHVMKDEVRVFYYGEDNYFSHCEDECFPSVDDLKDHIFKPLLDVQ